MMSEVVLSDRSLYEIILESFVLVNAMTIILQQQISWYFLLVENMCSVGVSQGALPQRQDIHSFKYDYSKITIGLSRLHSIEY